jgi:hypothetical protein
VNLKRYQVIILAIVVLVLMGIAGNMDVQEEERQHAEYCEMIQLWKQTGGQAGWPAYDGEDVCRDTQFNEKGAGGEQ